MNHSTPGLPVHRQYLEFTQTHVHWVGDAIQPSHPLSSPSPPAPNPYQHQGLFQWVNSSNEVAKVLEFPLLPAFKVCMCVCSFALFFYLFFLFICSEFCHTLEWNSHGFTCVPNPIPPPCSFALVMSDSVQPCGLSLPGSSIHGILQARILAPVAISFSRWCSQPRDRAQVSCIAGSLFTVWASREAAFSAIAVFFSVVRFLNVCFRS